MDVVYERCAGIDISKADVKVCIRVPGAGRRRRGEVRTFTSMTSGLLAMRDWLLAEGVTVVGMEATGIYWKPVFYLLEHDMECWLLNARHMKAVPGRKTDVKDAEWIAKLVEHGLVRPSFVPPEPIRQLRDLTRYRTEVIRERTREAQRLEKLLEDAGIKLSCVVSDILGVSGRAMLEALIAGERDPRVLADLAKRRLRLKIPDLIEALTGRFGDHHAFLARAMLDRIDAATAMEARLSTHIGTALEPMRRSVQLLATIPGVSTRAAEVILAEIGTDMSRFASAEHLASWAGVCPGNHESAGRQPTGRTRHGDPWLKAALGQAAMAAARTKNTYLAARYRRLVARRGKRRAVVALEHSLLIAVWHMLTGDVPHQDLGGDYFLERTGKTRATRRLVSQLNQLGYQVSLQPAGTS
ncbi:Transposase IS116/IS110/IS902 family protein (plasmid) [Streptomyces sp. YIM 121038]|uniref:IS110 family transposase n=1 Tax=Streptomyces sp. YIM 121038 TaxID=2136401 RepID=UPI0011102115|nr:IS110 family transposase [Streptomyces sp. YIM 121038]QCX82722.1 Transposase IS116/IS110/IS902 family protein [Streptomyces sp. YIM 121038]